MLTCTVHMLGHILAKATRVLRALLKLAQVKGFETYRLHALRRGHALDLQMSSASLADILAAGEWRSPAFMKYLSMHQLQEDLVIEAHLEESEPEDE